MISKKLIKQLESLLVQMPAVWDGRRAILKMRKTDYPHWKQMEWIGFYFQFLCDTKLPPLMKIPGPKYGRVEFDGFSEIPWDFKVHPNKNANDQDNKSVIVNDRLAIAEAIKKFGGAGIILAIGTQSIMTKAGVSKFGIRNLRADYQLSKKKGFCVKRLRV